MSITTENQILAGMQYPRFIVKGISPTLVAGRPHSFAYIGSYPPAASAPSSGIGGEVLTSWVGQVPFTNPTSGNTNLVSTVIQTTTAGLLILADRLWQNSGIDVTSTAEQTFTSSSQIPARDVLGTNAGVGIMAGLEVVTATGSGTPSLTLKYTNASGTAGQTAANLDTTISSSAIGAFYRFGLAAGDTGIQKAQSITLGSSWSSGTVSLVLYRPIAIIPVTSSNVPAIMDAYTLGFPQIFNNSCLFFIFIPFSTTATTISGQITWSQG